MTILNAYEIIYILKSDVTENHNLNLVQKYKQLIKKYGGKNIFIQHRGRRHLSYNIKNSYDGIYVQINFEGNSDLIKILEKSIKFNDQIIRYLITKQKFIYPITI